MLNVLYESTAVDTSINDIPTKLVKSVKNCDPTVLPVLLTTHKIRTAVDLPWNDISSNVGLIVIGNAYPKHYTQKVIYELQNTKRVSPLNFINANAGAAISICCTVFKFQGPTINFTLSRDDREEIANVMANHWLTHSDTKYIFIVKCDFNNSGICHVTNKLVSLHQ